MPAAWGDRERGAGTYNREGRGTNGLLWGGGSRKIRVGASVALPC